MCGYFEATLNIQKTLIGRWFTQLSDTGKNSHRKWSASSSASSWLWAPARFIPSHSSSSARSWPNYHLNKQKALLVLYHLINTETPSVCCWHPISLLPLFKVVRRGTCLLLLVMQTTRKHLMERVWLHFHFPSALTWVLESAADT